MRSPVGGRVLDLASVPDPVFAQQMVGPGVAVEPEGVSPPGSVPDPPPTQAVVAPVAGIVAALHPHAFVIETADGRAVLVHLGIDTVRLDGRGFDLDLELGATVRAGERVLTWSPTAVRAGGLAATCPVVALQAPAGAVTLLVRPGDSVLAGEDLFDWSA